VNFQGVTVNATKEAKVTLRNIGTAGASGIVALAFQEGGSFSFQGGYPGQGGGTCQDALDSGASCDLVVTFSPKSAADVSEKLKLAYNNGKERQVLELDLVGRGVAPGAANLTIDATSHNFGDVVVGQSARKEFTVKNEGGSPATNIQKGGLASMSSRFSYTADSTCGGGGVTTLVPQATCKVVVSFNPLLEGEASTDSISVSYRESAAALSSVLVGRGVLAKVESQPMMMAFGMVQIGNSMSLPLRLTNSGSRDATTLQVASLSEPLLVSLGDCTAGRTLARSGQAGNACTLTVRYRPTMAQPLPANTALSVTYMDGARTQTLSIPISGEGVPQPVPSLFAGLFDFGRVNVGQTAEVQLDVVNAGQDNARIVMRKTHAPFSIISTGNLTTECQVGAVVLPGQTCKLKVQFAPSIAGSFASDRTTPLVTLDYEGVVTTTRRTAVVPLTGIGVPAVASLTFDPSSIDFGSRPVGSSTTRTLFVQNNGNVDAAVSSIVVKNSGFPLPSELPVPFRIANVSNCSLISPLSLTPCRMDILFEPVEPILSECQLVIVFNGGLTAEASLEGLGKE
jgi:hypothetical protein